MLPTSQITPHGNGCDDDRPLTAGAVAAAKAAVEAQFDQLENEETSLPHWAGLQFIRRIAWQGR